jgi:hypothetical protein
MGARQIPCSYGGRPSRINDCDAGVTQNLPTLTKLTSLTLHGD